MESLEEPFESVFEAILKKTEVKTRKSQKRTKRVTQTPSFSDSKASDPHTDDSETPHPWYGDSLLFGLFTNFRRIAWIKKARRSNNDLLNAYVSFDSGVNLKRDNLSLIGFRNSDQKRTAANLHKVSKVEQSDLIGVLEFGKIDSYKVSPHL